MTVYEAGRMTGLSYNEMNDWREEATKLFNQYDIKTINPVTYYNFEMDKNFTDKECMLFDLTAVNKSDIILVNLHYDSIGTAIELYEAYKSNKPVIGFGAHENLHPWMKECCYKICDDLIDAVNYITSYYNGIL